MWLEESKDTVNNQNSSLAFGSRSPVDTSLALSGKTTTIQAPIDGNIRVDLNESQNTKMKMTFADLSRIDQSADNRSYIDETQQFRDGNSVDPGKRTCSRTNDERVSGTVFNTSMTRMQKESSIVSLSSFRRDAEQSSSSENSSIPDMRKQNKDNVLTVHQAMPALSLTKPTNTSHNTSMNQQNNLLQINAIEEQFISERKKEIEASFECNIVLLGGSGVGKTCLMRKLGEKFSDNFIADGSVN